MENNAVVDWVAPIDGQTNQDPVCFDGACVAQKAFVCLPMSCPSQGQAPSKHSGSFSLASAQSCRTASASISATGKRAKRDRTTAHVRVTRWCVARVPTVGIRVEIGKCASKIARIPARLSAYVPRPYWIGCMKELGIKSSSVLNRLDIHLKTLSTFKSLNTDRGMHADM
jgi:hypothetical protein